MTVADPISYFLEDMTYHGRSERTRDAYERVLSRFASYLEQETDATGLPDAGQRDCLAWIHGLRADGAAESTIATYASYLNRFYGYMVQAGVFEENPMVLVLEELEESIDTDPTRRDVTVPQMREFVDGVTHPLDRAIVLTLLKTGIRVGELANLDLRDCHLPDHPVRGEYAIEARSELANRRDALYVPADVARGDVVGGEKREASNKRERGTVVPVDDELGDALASWLAVRPDAHSPAEPLFVSTRSEWGQRVTPGMVRQRLEDYTRAAGWYRSGGSASENVTPHYFRHFFTTHLRDRTGDRGVVKYLRGDVADDVIDTYTHNWGDRVREVYEEHVYSLT